MECINHKKIIYFFPFFNMTCFIKNCSMLHILIDDETVDTQWIVFADYIYIYNVFLIEMSNTCMKNRLQPSCTT